MLVYFSAQMHRNWSNKTNFREIFSIFHDRFVHFYLKLENLIFIFDKVQIKIVNFMRLICGNKLNVCMLRETILFFILALLVIEPFYQLGW